MTETLAASSPANLYRRQLTQSIDHSHLGLLQILILILITRT